MTGDLGTTFAGLAAVISALSGLATIYANYKLKQLDISHKQLVKATNGMQEKLMEDAGIIGKAAGIAQGVAQEKLDQKAREQ